MREIFFKISEHVYNENFFIFIIYHLIEKIGIITQFDAGIHWLKKCVHYMLFTPQHIVLNFVSPITNS